MGGDPGRVVPVRGQYKGGERHDVRRGWSRGPTIDACGGRGDVPRQSEDGDALGAHRSAAGDQDDRRSSPVSALRSTQGRRRGEPAGVNRGRPAQTSASRRRAPYSAISSSLAYFWRGQKNPRRPSPFVRGTTCTCTCGTA